MDRSGWVEAKPNVCTQHVAFPTDASGRGGEIALWGTSGRGGEIALWGTNGRGGEIALWRRKWEGRGDSTLRSVHMSNTESKINKSE